MRHGHGMASQSMTSALALRWRGAHLLSRQLWSLHCGIEAHVLQKRTPPRPAGIQYQSAGLEAQLAISAHSADTFAHLSAL